MFKLPKNGKYSDCLGNIHLSNRSKTGLCGIDRKLCKHVIDFAHKKTASFKGGLTRSKLGLCFPVPVFLGFGLEDRTQ